MPLVVPCCTTEQVLTWSRVTSTAVGTFKVYSGRNSIAMDLPGNGSCSKQVVMRDNRNKTLRMSNKSKREIGTSFLWVQNIRLSIQCQEFAQMDKELPV